MLFCYDKYLCGMPGSGYKYLTFYALDCTNIGFTKIRLY